MVVLFTAKVRVCSPLLLAPAYSVSFAVWFFPSAFEGLAICDSVLAVVL